MVLDVQGLRTWFFTGEGIVRAVDGVDLSVRAGQTLGIVGESGCGKTVTALSIMRLLDAPGRVVAGRIGLRGRELLELSEQQMREVRGRDIAMVFQEPMTALNPAMRAGDQVAEAVRRHRGLRGAAVRRRVVELFERVGIAEPQRCLGAFPHQLSGGTRQRVVIAMAVSCGPRLLIADEPTSALDVTTQAQILELLDELRRTEEMAVIHITHDLGVIAEVADDVVVMRAGRVVEAAGVRQLFAHPQHPYTQELLTSMLASGEVDVT